MVSLPHMLGVSFLGPVVTKSSSHLERVALVLVVTGFFFHLWVLPLLCLFLSLVGCDHNGAQITFFKIRDYLALTYDVQICYDPIGCFSCAHKCGTNYCYCLSEKSN